MRSRWQPAQSSIAIAVLLAGSVVHAHDHQPDLSEADLAAPIDNVLWLHIAFQVMLWGILWPLGMILGLVRSRWHVPLQVTNFALTALGYVLGHLHGGRKFHTGAHQRMANILLLPLGTMLVVGIYLKLHIHEKTIRPYFVKLHGIIGRTWPLLAWVQMLFGAITLGDYCDGDAREQCIAHYYTGSVFVWYGVFLLLVLLLGGWNAWLEQRNLSQEYIDSWAILIFGIINTFTSRRESHWSHGDMQHISFGVLWWAGGALGVLLSSKGRRSLVPSLVLLITGWALAAHEHTKAFTTRVHGMFGFALAGAAVARMVEICFIDGRPTATTGWAEAWRMLTPFGLISGGIIFIGATDEEIAFASSDGVRMDHEVYILLMFSIALLVQALVGSLARVYLSSGQNAPGAVRNIKIPDTGSEEYIQLAPTGGSSPSRRPSQDMPYSDRDRDAEQFSIGEDDDDDATVSNRRSRDHAAPIRLP